MIPTVLGLVALVGLMGLLALGVKGLPMIVQLWSKASGGAEPANVRVANVSDTSFSVVWTTEQVQDGAVSYSEGPEARGKVAVDERALVNPNGKYSAHLVRVSGLKAVTKYYFKIQVGGTSFGDSGNSGSPYSVTTGPKLGNATIVDPIYGQATGGEGAIVIWQSPGAAELAAIVKGDGNYVLPLANARKADLSDYFSLKGNTSENVLLLSGTQQATISCVYGKDRPLPTVKLGETIDCQKGRTTAAKVNKVVATSSGQVGFKPTKGGLTGNGRATIDISSGETVSSSLPTIAGKARPGQVVKIQIHSDVPYSGVVVADPAGNWSWTPPANLSAGQHTVTITVVNADGATQTVTRTFFVSPGSPILPVTSGTPSATLTHMACLNNACTTVDGAGSDACSADSDCGATSTPSATPAPEPTPPPSTGATEITLAMLVLGLILVGFGGKLLLAKSY